MWIYEFNIPPLTPQLQTWFVFKSFWLTIWSYYMPCHKTSNEITKLTDLQNSMILNSSILVTILKKCWWTYTKLRTHIWKNAKSYIIMNATKQMDFFDFIIFFTKVENIKVKLYNTIKNNLVKKKTQSRSFVITIVFRAN